MQNDMDFFLAYNFGTFESETLFILEAWVLRSSLIYAFCHQKQKLVRNKTIKNFYIIPKKKFKLTKFLTAKALV